MIQITTNKQMPSYDAFKKTSLEVQPLTRNCTITDFDIVDKETISFRGMELKCSDQAIRDLNKVLGIPVALGNSLETNLGADAKHRLTEMIKMCRTLGGKNLDCTVVINPDTKCVQRIIKGSSLLNNSQFFTLFEGLTDGGDWTIDQMSQGFDGSVNISVMNKKSEFQVGKMRDEIFYPGFNFSSNMQTGLNLDTFVHRLVCTNGMVGHDKQKSVRLLDFKTPTEFFEKLHAVKQSNFIPTNFTEDVVRASATKASLAEVRNAAYLIKTMSDCPLDNIDQFIPYNAIRRAFAKKGLDTTLLNKTQEANAITNVPVWDVVNGLTDFASHEYGFKCDGRNRVMLQGAAHRLLTKSSYDTQNLVNISL